MERQLSRSSFSPATRRRSLNSILNEQISSSLRSLTSDPDRPNGEPVSTANDFDGAQELVRSNFSICFFRGLIFTLILMIGIAISTGTYFVLQRLQAQLAQQTYTVFAMTFSEALTLQTASLVESARALSALLTATALTSKAVFPNMTLPLWETHVGLLLEHASMESIAWIPIVTDRSAWEAYSVEQSGLWLNQTIEPFVHTATGAPTRTDAPWAPIWQTTPPRVDLVNLDVWPDLQVAYEQFQVSRDPLMMGISDSFQASFIQPVHQYLNRSQTVGMVVMSFSWQTYLTHALHTSTFNSTSVTIVVRNTCGDVISLSFNGSEVVLLGDGDWHDGGYNSTRVDIPFLTPPTVDDGVSSVQGVCTFTVSLFADQVPTPSNQPIVLTAVVASIFLVVILAFVMYDRFARKRSHILTQTAVRSNALISSLFPKAFVKQLFAEKKPEYTENGHVKLQHYLEDDMESVDSDDIYEGRPIADLFPETTVLFADIAGFSAWSSTREPVHVFRLLETIFKAFDEIAKRRRVYKVETVGDCYVAVTGLPDRRQDHAVAMARFARDCVGKMRVLTKKLEVILGPDTADLHLRVGIHSGPVTGGVLRGDKSRFQLFGDTMNTASRMESTGEQDKIQLSQDTADLLISAGKAQWIQLRDSTVVAKGKGEVQTYWLTVFGDGSGDSSSGDTEDGSENAIMDESGVVSTNPRISRLVEWNVEILLRLLKQIVARRQACLSGEDCRITLSENHFSEYGETTIDEVAEIITLPTYDASATLSRSREDDVVLRPEVEDQLYDYVSNISSMYNDNPFHNFDHASHVSMSVTKLLSRIVAPSQSMSGEVLHDHTYGITSDPLTQFACVFSALIHDADHAGVPNAQLVKEGVPIVEYYKGKSVAEQNSVDLAWQMLMDEAYIDLRRTIYTSDEELKRFRQLVVNSVMATDIIDKELKELRNARWAKAFSDGASDTSSRDAVNRKATIVIEHLIQASDVAHTMQHWHVYRKWNERFFLECHKAWKEGRAEKNPADGWYEGEIGFFDFYIIPLAKKLKDCGVFGVSSDEYLNYATNNRREWEERGRGVVAEMVEFVEKDDSLE